MSGIKITDRKLFRRYKVGYEVWDETWENGGGPIRMRQAYTPDGHYIGSQHDGHVLCAVKAIKPELVRPDANVCSIGYCPRDSKWYGWSHRAIFGFSVGAQVKRGDCGYQPTDKEDFRLDCIRFWSDEHHIDVRATEQPDGDVLGVKTEWDYDDTVPNKSLVGTIGGDFSEYPETWGRGKWTATTIDDARKMACDFAEGVS